MQALSAQTKRQAMYWASYFAEEWAGDTPRQWNPALTHLLPNSRTPRDGGEEVSRARTTRAIRRLRKASVREYEVLYRILILGDSIEGVTAWLNERAVRNAIPLEEGKTVHYTEQDAWVLFISGVDFVRQAW